MNCCSIRGLRRDLARKRGDAQGCDAVAALAQHVKAKAVKGEALSRLRDRPRLVDDDAGDGGRLVVGNVPIHRPVEVAHRHRAVDIDRTVRLRPHAGHRDVVLVADVADDLLDDVLDRHQAFHLAVFVDHQRERRLAAAKRLELLVERRRVGHEPGRRHHRHDVDLGGVAARRLQGAQHFLGVQHADDVVGRAAPQRQPRQAAASTAWMISPGGSSASIVTMLVRWTMTSDTRARADRAGRPSCRDRAFPPCRRDASGRRRHAVLRAATGSTGSCRPACRHRAV